MAEMLSVVVGGLLAVGGGGTMQWYLNKIQRENEDKRQRAIKFEELVSAIYEYDHWLMTYRNIHTFGSDDTETPTPFAKIQAITLIYFPEHLEKVKELQNIANDYIVWIHNAAVKRLAKDNSIQEGFKDVYQTYAAAHHELLKDLSEFSKRVFK
ncbi:hypothetical protein MnTg02_02315 [bacterium MnTg02]|nr:hypothetical protein MnTg02_02315 [bacterium MnTg02]